MQEITTFLMFEGNAEQAMNFYISLFPESAIKSISRYEENEDGPAGTVRLALFSLNGQEFICIDSAVKHGFSFTPAMSLYVRCDRESDVDKLYAGLTEGGQVLMPLGEYPFSRKYAWVNDKYGVSWQISLEGA
jgi:predicted 3-demethylubiquinone-9 3-methyltransferase (glyoxalase superfamily)